MFSPQSLKFLKTASNKSDALWFEKNRETYHELLKQPFTEVLEAMNARFQKDLPHFRFSPRSISRPLRMPDRDKEKSPVKDFIACSMSPRKTSRFEMPPGFYLSIGVNEIFFGAGLYMPSGPQFRSIRLNIQDDPKQLSKILDQKKFKSTFGGLNSEEMSRGPRGFSVEPKYQHLLMKRSFSVHKKFTAKELTSKSFTKKVVETAEAALPLIQWLENSIR